MPDEEKNEQSGRSDGDAAAEQEQAPDEAAADAAASGETAPDPEAAGETAPEADAAADAAAGETAPEAATPEPSEQGEEGEPEAVEPKPAGDAAPAEEQSPKELRKRERSLHRGEPGPARSPAERAAERAEARRRRAAERRRWRLRRRERRRTGGAAGPATTPPVDRGARGRRRVRQGVVVSDKPDKTITVRIDLTRAHRTYKKVVRESSTLHVHDERNDAGVGDTVRVVESRPLSRTKRWRLVEVLERAR